MWNVVDIHGQSSAVIFHDSGWTVTVMRRPGTSKPNVYFDIHAPDGVLLDHNRPPFVFGDGNIILDGGSSLSAEILCFKLVDKYDGGEHYEAFDGRISMCVWHGNPQEGVAEFIHRLMHCRILKVELFTQPYGTTTIEMVLDGTGAAIRSALGL